MNAYIPVPDPITPEWLTAVLRESGVLREGEVTAVETKTTGAFNSLTNRLILDYSADTTHGSPAHLVMKRNVPEAWGQEAGMIEVKFYQLIDTLPDHPAVIIPCYGAAYDEQSGNSYVILKDLSETHRPPVTRDQQISIVEGVPPPAYIDAVVDTLAQFHAYWWDHPELKPEQFEVGYWTRNAERFEQYLQRRRTSWASLIADEKEWFPDDLRELYEQVFARLPYHWEHYLKPRFQEMRNLTLVHGDTYFTNFLCPKEPGSGVTYLLDWQSPGVDIGGYDVANLCAAFWTSQQRHEDQREERMLRRYHLVLQEHGVTNYTWDELLTDYKIGLIFWLLMPLQDRHDGAGKEYWWPKLQCAVAAFRDWDCEQLLGS